MAKYPDHIRGAYTMHFTSDATGLDIAVTLSNLGADLPVDKIAAVPEAVLSLAPDMRPMTRDEVDEYIESEKEDEE